MIRLSTRGALTALLLTAGAAAAVVQDEAASTTYVTANADALVRSYPDKKGPLVARLDQGALLRVHGQSTGKYTYYDVEIAGGLPVWVHGSLISTTDNAEVLRIDAANVNMRPTPSSGRDALPLPTKLQRGTRVQMLGRHDVTKPLAEDWVQIQSPEGTRAWILADQTAPHTDAAAAAAAWGGMRAALPTAPAAGAASGAANTSAAAETPTKPIAGAARDEKPVPKSLFDKLAAADRAYDGVKDRPDATAMEIEPVVEAYRGVIADAPAGSNIQTVAQYRLESAEVLLRMAMLNDRIIIEEQRNQELLDAALQKEKERQLRSTPLWGRFNGRGWLEREQAPGKDPRWFLRFSGERQVEILSSSGRYDLANYEGFQIGVQGITRREAAPVTLETDGLLQQLDVFKIEVISGGRSSR